MPGKGLELTSESRLAMAGQCTWHGMQCFHHIVPQVSNALHALSGLLVVVQCAALQLSSREPGASGNAIARGCDVSQVLSMLLVPILQFRVGRGAEGYFSAHYAASSRAAAIPTELLATAGRIY
jgi:hypothetical protein